jgi:hypothetical protein
LGKELGPIKGMLAAMAQEVISIAISELNDTLCRVVI